MVRKGLNIPEKRHRTPLDVHFEEVAGFLEVDEDGVPVLNQCYSKCGGEDDVDDFHMVDLLIDKAFKLIFEIQRLAEIVRQDNSQDADKANLIAVSLHDLKYFNELINFIIVQLVYPILPIDVGIPLNERRLKSFNDKSIKFQYKSIKNKNNNELLIKIVQNFEKVFLRNDDLKELLIKGTGLIDILTCLIVLIHKDESFVETYQFFENQSDTYNLYSIYALLLQSTTNPKYKQFISFKLSMLTITRSNGVLSLIDFVIGIRDDEDINIEKFNTVNKILLAVPKTISKPDYFKTIFVQIYEILVFIDRPILLSVALNFIQRVYQLNKRIVHDFLFTLIWQKLDPKVVFAGDYNDIVVTEKEFNDVINVLISLTKESSIDFLNELFYPIFLNLWSYLNYLNKAKNDYFKIVLKVFVSFFKITKNNDFLKIILLNLVKFQINDDLKFVTTIENNLTSIQKKNKDLVETYSNEEFFNDIESSIDLTVLLFKEINDNDLVREQFLIVLNRWILQSNNNNLLNEEENPFLMLIDLKLLEKMNEIFKESLLEKPQEVLLMIKNILTVKVENSEKDFLVKEEINPDDADSDDEDLDIDDENSDNLNVLLELLSAIISETDPSILKSKYQDTLLEISKLLLNFSNNKYCLSLNSRITDILNNNITSNENLGEKNDELLKDKELFEKALNNMNDPLVPIRAHGLYLLRQLITKKSEILSINNVLELHLLQLNDTEPFIYLNVIKSLNDLLELNEFETLKNLMDYYFNNDDKSNLIDDRLKIGEVLLNYVQRKNELLVSNELIDELIYGIIKQINNCEMDNKLRMSSMSILGEALRTNAVGLLKFVKDSIDCSIGILELENDVVMKRSAVILINDLVLNDIELIPKGYGEKLKTLLNFVKVNTDDYLLIEQIDKLLININEMVKERLNFKYDMPAQFKSFKI